MERNGGYEPALNQITGAIIHSAMELHTRLGPGLFESVYTRVLEKDLSRSGLRVERQVAVPIEYEGLTFDEAFRADLIVEGAVIVEVKSVSELAPVHARQLLTYLRLLDLRVGLLLNFNSLHLSDGIRRVVNRYVQPPAASSAPSAAPRVKPQARNW
ncbi:MAG TPA: GxxExxY protein [Longimicrobiales bacterium]|nr:GxxExxY protein [Longimicrobiales bacterium]